MWGQLAVLAGQAGLSWLSNRGKDSSSDNFNSAQAFNAAEAQKNRDFEERMFKNRHQFEVADLEAAGLNKILSAGGQPPLASGATASSPQPDYSAKDRSTRRYELGISSAKTASEILLNKSLAGKADAEADSARGTVGLFGTKVPMSRIPGSSLIGMAGNTSAKSMGNFNQRVEYLKKLHSKGKPLIWRK